MRRKIIMFLLTISILLLPSAGIADVDAAGSVITIKELYNGHDLIDALIGYEAEFFVDLFPMQANWGDVTDITAEFWATTEQIAGFELKRLDRSLPDGLERRFDYCLSFDLQPEYVGDRTFANVMLTFFANSNVVQVSARNDVQLICGEEKIGFYMIDEENKAVLEALFQEAVILSSDPETDDNSELVVDEPY